jgi:hypothetical protein
MFSKEYESYYNTVLTRTIEERKQQRMRLKRNAIGATYIVLIILCLLAQYYKWE